MSRALSWLLFAPAAGLWWASLFKPALKQPGGGSFHYTGLSCLSLGWIGFLGRPLWALPWSANVLYAISLVRGLLHRPGLEALVLSLIAIPLSLVTFANRTIYTDEAGNSTAVIPGPGFYLWLASLMALVAAQLVMMEGR